MQNIAILCDSNPLEKPRPNRMIQMLREHYSLFVFGYPFSHTNLQGIQCFDFPARKSAKDRTKEEQSKLEDSLKARDFLPLIFTPNRLVLQEKLLAISNLHLLIVEDIVLLPLALLYKEKNPKTKIMIDLREFYPLEYENDSYWLETFGKFFDFLCRNYLLKVDFALTVSEGLKQKYKETYHLDCEVFLSLPPYFDLSPSKNSRIEIIYHGLISQDRESHNLLEIAKSLKPHLHLNLIVLSNQEKFLESFLNEVKTIPSISLFPPLPLEEIIPFSNAFDLGLLTLKPNGFNNTHALPNKFFEYIQARLGVIATPLPEIKPLIARHKIGTCAKDFQTSSLIELLNSLEPRLVEEFKNNANKTSKILNFKTNQDKILSIIHSLLGE